MVAVLHDLNQAARYATHLVVMKSGKLIAAGAPEEILSAELVEKVFGLPCIVVPDAVTGTPMVIPQDRRARGPGRSRGPAEISPRREPTGRR